VHTVVLRLASAVALLWLVITLTFVLVRAAPGDPAALLIAPSATAAEIASARAALGLDDPIATQYARWIGGIVSGNLGESIARRRPVAEVLGDALPLSIALGAISLALTFAVGISIGMFQAARRGRPMDTVLTLITTTVFAAPSFWLSLALVAVFTYGASKLGFPTALRLPAFGVSDPAGQYTGAAAVVDVMRHMILPIVVLAAIGAAGIARYARTAFADVLGADYVRTARAKGLGTRLVYVRHVLANALPPLVVLLALSLPGILAGSVFVESVFALPGMGRVMLTAIASRDYPVVLGATLIYATLVIVANLLVDVVLPLVDPRRRSA
jgi:peptide/nickel transport system permease protein